jgi:integrase
MKLDTKTLATLDLPAGKVDHIIWDEDLAGFGLRLRQGGRRVWIAQYRPSGSRRTRRVTLGSIEKLAPAQAREGARKLLARVALGQDPQGEKEAKRAQSARTFRSAVESYLAAKQPDLRPVSYRIAKLYLLDGDYFRPLHPLCVSAITRPDIAARLSAITRTHSPHVSAAARRAASAAFRWFTEEGWTTTNPVVGTRRPTEPMPRDRVLTDAELVAIWNACDDDDFGRIVRLLILLGSRRQEVGGMRWSELDLAAGTWTLPADRSKNHRAHTVALPGAALAIIAGVPRTHRDHLFGDRASDGFMSWHRGKQDLDRRLTGPVKPWRLHDIRRTVATGMADIGIEPHVIEAALNHYSGHRRGVAGVYNRSNYERAVKQALARWSEHVLALVEGRESNVVALSQRVS